MKKKQLYLLAGAGALVWYFMSRAKAQPATQDGMLQANYGMKQGGGYVPAPIQTGSGSTQPAPENGKPEGNFAGYIKTGDPNIYPEQGEDVTAEADDPKEAINLDGMNDTPTITPYRGVPVEPWITPDFRMLH